ncbi:unnamed protein product [Arabis nemorensis]|uniref:Tubulin/FtsZ GTPase domain-containing protein n=1 Tax=Arabis nemorensis TaxID=586526 RepID=A0A565BMB6_9BRAS|nr:unnamed protein product [Arabis nemorensis]
MTTELGGGTGTGAAPIVVEFAKDLNVFTIGVVSMPFPMEGVQIHSQAVKSFQNLKLHVDH